MSGSLLRPWRWWRCRAALARVRLLVLDVDGVLTDGGLWYGATGEPLKRFDVRDGLGIRLLQQAGIEVAFLSGGRGGAAEIRAAHLGVRHCWGGVADKPEALCRMQAELALGPERTAFVGDDYNDLAVRQVVGLLVATADAVPALSSGAVDGQAAESVRVNRATGDTRLMAVATAPRRMVPLPTGGIAKLPVSGSETLLTPAEIRQLIDFADEIPRKFPQQGEDGKAVAADVEFAFVDGRLWLLQIRPFNESREAQASAYLAKMDEPFNDCDCISKERIILME